MSTQQRSGRRGASQRVRTVLLAGAAVLIILLAVLNTETVTVNWIFGSTRAPLVLVVVISFLLGVVCCYLVERLRSRGD